MFWWLLIDYQIFLLKRICKCLKKKRMSIRSLYIIGNGFDVHHKIKSRYIDFYEWLKEDNSDVCDKIKDLYGEDIVDDEWWSDFETSLGNLNFREIIEDYSWQNQPSEDDIEKMRSIDTMGGAWDIQTNVGETIECIKNSFHAWVDSLSPAKRALKVHLDPKDSYFINFNYTLTLENTYDISPERVCHIHGSVKDDEYVIGHGRSKEEIEEEASPYLEPYNGHMDPSEYGIDAIDDEITENTKQEMIAQVISIRKPVEELLKQLEPLFDKLDDVEKLTILGLSFSDVDMPYLKAIFDRIPQDTNLIISYYSKRDKENIENRMKDYKFKYELIRLEDLQIIKQNKLFWATISIII